MRLSTIGRGVVLWTWALLACDREPVIEPVPEEVVPPTENVPPETPETPVTPEQPATRALPVVHTASFYYPRTVSFLPLTPRPRRERGSRRRTGRG